MCHPRYCLAHHPGISFNISNVTHFSTQPTSPRLARYPRHHADTSPRQHATHINHASTYGTLRFHPRQHVQYVISQIPEILKGFDANPSLDTCGIFLDISKVFDRVWHEALIFKLRSYSISDSLLFYSIVFFLKDFKE